MENAGMVIATIEVRAGVPSFIQPGKYFAVWFGGPHHGETLSVQELAGELRGLKEVTCRRCGKKISTGWVHVNIVHPARSVFAAHAECIGK